jgi:hypothetical protein
LLYQHSAARLSRAKALIEYDAAPLFFKEGSNGSGTGAAIMITAFSQARSAAQKIFDNIIFLEDIFGDREDEEIPDIPVLELAKSFELSGFGGGAASVSTPRR